MEEIWKPIVGFERYQISNFGRVKGIRVPYLQWLYSLRGGNYPFVDLRGHDEDGNYVRKICLIHILVAEHFLGPRPEGHVVHHLDCNRRNPVVTNLMYVTVEENSRPEEWREIEGFPDYQVSNLGRVRSFKRDMIKILKIMTNRGGGYAFVGLYRGTAEGPRRKLINVHNLVAAAFLGPTPPGMVIDHKNRNSTDARASNLQFLTHRQNSLRRL